MKFNYIKIQEFGLSKTLENKNEKPHFLKESICNAYIWQSASRNVKIVYAGQT